MKLSWPLKFLGKLFTINSTVICKHFEDVVSNVRPNNPQGEATLPTRSALMVCIFH